MKNLIEETNNQFRKLFWDRWMMIAVSPVIISLFWLEIERHGSRGAGVVLLSILVTMVFVYWVLFFETVANKKGK